MASAAKRIAIIGSGNWGSTIAKIVGNNAAQSDKFETIVNMYVYEEMINGRKLTEIINNDHENVKYLPGHILPANVVAVPDVVAAARDADILIFVLPHQFMTNTCRPLRGQVKPEAFGVSLCKGFYVNTEGQVDLISNMVKGLLGIECAVIMGANIANEVAAENFCEATVGSQNAANGHLLKEALQTPYFRIVVSRDAQVVESCGALKNIVAVGAGLCDGLGFGDNTKAAVIRLGLMEMIKFAEVFYPAHDSRTFFESCGIADLVTTCYGGRNRKVAAAFSAAKGTKTIEDLEKEMLNGQKLQGPETAKEVNMLLKSKDMEERFPLFTSVHKICTGATSVESFIDGLKNHPEHL
jgi:glycerol-3-phosphate dehydrogenase (NAD+)